MRVQIYGAGMAGSYLYHLLRNKGIDVSITDIRKTPDCRCAWGIENYSEVKELYKKIGIDFDDYVLVRIRKARTPTVGVELSEGSVIFNKRKLLVDLWEDLQFEKKDADVIVDATGYSRAILPPIPDDRLIPTVQTLERVEGLDEETLYFYPSRFGEGYAWAFPAGDNKWHIGAGDLRGEGMVKYLIEKLRESFKIQGEVLCKCKAFVRHLPPSRCVPVVSGNVYGVGESIGCVNELGGGNLLALRSAALFAKYVCEDALDDYERGIFSEFKYLEKSYTLMDEFRDSIRKRRLLKSLRAGIKLRRELKERGGDNIQKIKLKLLFSR
ncbi:MAG: NAD(P)/FAD-dependent oxidoreductase [Candidatus Methanospirareceae archaeon]